MRVAPLPIRTDTRPVLTVALDARILRGEFCPAILQFSIAPRMADSLHTIGGGTTTLPAALDRVLNDVGMGAMLKHLRTERLAMIVDMVDDGRPSIIVVSPTKEHSWPRITDDYELFVLENYDEWIVLTPGQDDYVFDED